MKTIDLTTWARRKQYAFFRGFARPHFSLCAEVDCTRLLEELKPAGVAPFNAVLWCLLAAANDVPELRQRLRGDQVIEHAQVHPSVTVPTAEDGFAFCHLSFDPDWASFDRDCRAAFAAAAARAELVDAEGDHWLYLSCLPWVSFSSMSNPVRGPDDCVPRITWGRFAQREGRWKLPVAAQVHHALVDGRHLGRFYAGVERRLAELTA
ncbi:MAG: chloramphenicol acetyltransferase [Planctomycetes bacterium]|nr:chloramphenicol acetyltransferase [Planctomycetota bacterium]